MHCIWWIYYRLVYIGRSCGGVLCVRGKCRFVHAGHGKDTRMTFSKDGATAACMRVVVDDAKGAAGEYDDDAFTVFSLARSPRKLPRFVVFKGYNDRYLSGLATTINDGNQLRFSAGDPGDPTVLHEITYFSNGAFFVRNIHLNRYWGYDNISGEWVLAMYTPGQQTEMIDAQFATVDVNDYFAIRFRWNIGTKYSRFWTVPRTISCFILSASR